MNVQLINKQSAINGYNKLKEIAFAIAAGNDTLPGYCNAPECIEFMHYAALTQLKAGEVCLFIDNLPVMQITDFEIAPGQFFIGRMCTTNVEEAYIDNDILSIKYHDGVIECYIYENEFDAWKFHSKNIRVNTPSTSAN